MMSGGNLCIAPRPYSQSFKNVFSWSLCSFTCMVSRKPKVLPSASEMF